MSQSVAALQDFDPVYDRCGSFTTEAIDALHPRMSASLQKRTSKRSPQYVRL